VFHGPAWGISRCAVDRVANALRGYAPVMDVTEATFDEAVIARSHDVPVVADFWADWCGPCHALGPVLEREVEARHGAVELVKVDVDQNPALAQRFGVSGIPAVKAFRDGRVSDEFVGALSPTAVGAFLDRLTAPPRVDALVEELRASGELPAVVAALDAGDVERALELILADVPDAAPEVRDRLRDVAVALFERLGQDDPLATTYRRRLASALY
jgi:thioredoxin